MTPPLLTHTRIAAEGREPARWLLVLHGIYGSGRNWGSLARRLVEDRPEWGVLLVDLRLHGGSRDFPGPHTVAAAAGDVNRLVDALDFHAAAVLGHSFGGKVALSYAERHADGLRQIWVVDSTLAVREPSGSAWRIIEVVRSLPERFSSRDELVDAMERHGYARPLGLWLAMNLERSDEGFRWRLDWDGMEEMLRDYFRTDLWEVIDHPPEGVQVHVVKATESSAIDEADVERIEAAARATGRVHLHLVRGGHWLNTENPEGVLALLEEGLE
jgi:pimeloyl-ACP methyl ester carboxylesterase